MPVLPVHNVREGIEFFTGVLGFKLSGSWGDGEPAFAIVALDKITVALQHDTKHTAPAGWSAYLYVTDAQEMAKRAKSNGATLLREPEKTFYGMLEFDLRDPSGNTIAFGQDLDPEA